MPYSGHRGERTARRCTGVICSLRPAGRHLRTVTKSAAIGILDGVSYREADHPIADDQTGDEHEKRERGGVHACQARRYRLLRWSDLVTLKLFGAAGYRYPP
ncbi:hypothetical protein GCM10023107_88970 [Actinoplanes octamycinicus]|nr:hypothetical protein Aoc01nite_64380 [Actinoplanes octamycinicus]